MKIKDRSAVPFHIIKGVLLALLSRLAEKYLPETFRSLSLQDDFELIFVDDGSTDSSLEKIEKFAKND